MDADPPSAAPARIAVACLVATAAFWAYTATLLPGVDLGDTGGFQAAVLWPETSARRAYPLYYALAAPFVASLSAANPARGLNLFSAVWAALCAGLLAYLGAVLTRSLLAGAAGGLLLAFSYTFWTQAVIAEVYSLHLALVAGCLIALHRFADAPARGRLFVFLLLYGVSFGNHLLMILLFVPFAVFVLQVDPRRRELFEVPVLALALAGAAAGALLYAGNFLSVWWSPEAPAAWTERVAAFWFDTTKADWRESMVLGVRPADTWNRLAMWAWDARQQFGIAGLVLAVAGWIRLWTLSRPWAVLVTLAYLVTTLFALTYNVGDPHVFFLPGHLLVAVAIAAALAPARTTAHRARAYGALHLAAASAVLLLAAWRAWDTWPAVDRSADRRADALVARVAAGLSDETSILASQMDWQSENALLYSSRYERRDLAWTRLSDVLPYFPFLVRDNHAAGRDVVLTAEAAADVVAAYGSFFPMRPDVAIPPGSLTAALGRLPRGTPYLVSLLTPPRDERFDRAEFDRALGAFMPAPAASGAAYQVWAGLSGSAPAVHLAAERPFRQEFSLLGDRFEVRMDAWLPFDTFRRGGFGHVIRGREKVLTVERGASFVWFERDGSPSVAYLGGLYAPEPRFRIPAGANLELATLPK